MGNGSRIRITGDTELLKKLDEVANPDDFLLPAIDSTFAAMGQTLLEKYEAIPKKNHSTATQQAKSNYIQVPAYREDESQKVIAKVGFKNTAPQTIFFEVGTPYIQPHYYIEATRNEYGETLENTILNKVLEAFEVNNK